MLRRLIPLVFVPLCVGCSGQVGLPTGSASPQTSKEPTLELAGSVGSGPIGLYRDGAVVHVGDLWETAKGVFPAGRTAYDLHDLPQSFPNKFEAHGWETPTGEGFGAITLDSKVVAAMYQLERTKEDSFDELLKAQQTGMGSRQPDVISGRSVNYWFWTDSQNHQLLMVCELSTTAGENVTLAMGDENVLAKLNISEADAKREVGQLNAVQNGNQPTQAKN